eukprot:COSAG03_NODE_6315_length_1079_cov_22.123469_1_plen_126_part_10
MARASQGLAALEGLFNATANHSGPLTRAEMGAKIDEAVSKLPAGVTPQELLRRESPAPRVELADRLRGAKPSTGCGSSGEVPRTGRYFLRVEDPLLLMAVGVATAQVCKAVISASLVAHLCVSLSL